MAVQRGRRGRPAPPRSALSGGHHPRAPPGCLLRLPSRRPCADRRRRRVEENVSTTTPSTMETAKERTAEAERAAGFAIGALDIAAQAGGSDLLGGYSGATARRYLLEAQKLIGKAKGLLDALPS